MRRLAPRGEVLLKLIVVSVGVAKNLDIFVAQVDVVANLVPVEA